MHALKWKMSEMARQHEAAKSSARGRRREGKRMVVAFDLEREKERGLRGGE
jgi:hypothetical protein